MTSQMLAGDASADWRFARVGLVVATALLTLQLAVGGVYALVSDDPSAYDLALRCLTREKVLAVDTAVRDPVARSASGGALGTVVEGNPVVVAFVGSERAADRLAATYRDVADIRPGMLERRGHVVYLWAAPASPTQRQTMYDCAG